MSTINKIEKIRKIVNILTVTNDLYEAIDSTPTRRWWVRPTNVYRDEEGFFKLCHQKIEEEDEEHFYMAFRMSVQQYKVLLNQLRPFLLKFSKRKPISPEIRLSSTLL